MRTHSLKTITRRKKISADASRRIELRQHKIRCDVAKVEPLEIKPTAVPTQVFVQPQVGIKEGMLMSGAFETVRQTREEFYQQHHFQTVLFEITRRLVSRLTDTQGGNEPKLKYHARHQLFPQVLAIVENYAEQRVRWNGCDPRELALEIYSQKLVGLLADAIEPDESGGEPPLLPVINRFNPTGATGDVSFTTKRPCHPTLKSHIDAVVLDTDTWERSVAFQLEASDAVAFYARNDHLGLEIPYEFYGVAHRYQPDFVVRLANGVNLLLEVKGYEGAGETAKHQAAKRWTAAVNNWGKMGRWTFHVCKNPDVLRAEVAWLNRRNFL
jgi:type III restriction enzyme